MAARMYADDESEQGIALLRNESVRRRSVGGPAGDMRRHFRQQLDGDAEDPFQPGPSLVPTDSIRRRLSLFEGIISPPAQPHFRGKLLPRPRPGKQGPPARDWRARLAIYTLYFAACVIGGRLIMQYSTPEIELCQPCSGSCGKLAHSYMIPENDMGGLPFGAVLGAGSPAYCTDSFCVPKPVRDPYGLCMAVQQDASLLHGMKRKLMSVEDEEGGDDDAGASKGAKWASYFSRRKLSALANSPLGAVSTPPPTGASSSPQSVGYTYPVTFNPSLLEDLDPSDAGCTYLQYGGQSSGIYVNTTDQPYMAVGNVKTRGQCCHLCAADSSCTHFTATSMDAGGMSNCYLKNVNSPAQTSMVGAPIPSLPQFPYVRFMDPSVPGITQSGAKTSTGIPAQYYGNPLPES